ncbi:MULTISPECIES: Gfo/Idh/MocA family protein [Pseudonocardia]|uniref:1,5-anhydro-D-fructose reductase n=2 Tax=Pseudonocardia TaxID=1847 RepID=A0A1Y2MZ20_PSEAH|nr:MULTISPECIES: Gfo/Idh/MocA family oxidoreductase [Pseudonocardia]OSY39888.1 1,5-anhydro-D-fructose reductase [Pseudonocardia autotrophica]TDN74484.1 putative dehydrogenase [Pseudonocardia autotrophica]GEC25741.1 putative oxidoreductase [Pseudonocardia saturnea]
MTVRWGVVGPGRIAEMVVRDFTHVPDAEVVAVASRSAERAGAFASRHGIGRTHTGYRAILDDPEVDVLYIATPHPQHRAVALAAIEAGKAIMVEKAFTVSSVATREIAAASRRTGVFAMEAMWTRFFPAVVRLRELLADGAIGEVRSVQADLGVRNLTDAGDRYLAPELGGGALFDLAVYPISFAQMVLGEPSVIAATGALGPTGVDLEESILLGWPDGRSAALQASLRCAMPGSARVIGTDGWIEVPPRFHHPDRIELHRHGAEPEEIVLPATGGGYAHEIAEVTARVAAGEQESPVMPLADTIAVQDVMAAVADQLGMIPEEGPATL